MLVAFVLVIAAWGFSGASLNAFWDTGQGTNAENTMTWRLTFEAPQDTVIAASQDPEHLLRQIYAALDEGDRVKALATASVLAKQFPTFQLGQLLYADLLNISTQAPVSLPEVEEVYKPALMKRLNELILESRRRLHHPSATKLQGRVPSALLFLSSQQSHIAVVDASQSRLYWFENRSQGHGLPQLQLVKETYVSVGSNGVGKVLEGDGKTPTGVYFIQKNLPGDTLPDFFGAGALTLNYPNAVDLMNKKTGSGIWLHGTPSTQYARAPESTDGCVVLSNPDISPLLHLPGLRMTPVIIAGTIDWVAADQQARVFNEFKQTLNSWLSARNGTDPQALKSHYSERFERDDMPLTQWWPRLAQTTLGHRVNKPLELLSVLQWQDKFETVVVTFKDPNAKASSLQPFLRTYWQKEAGQWKMVFQGPA